MIIFENTTDIEGIESDVQCELGPYYSFQELILHNFRNTKLTLSSNTKLGSLSVKTLSDKVQFIPYLVEEKHFDKMFNHHKNAQNIVLCEQLSSTICKMLQNTSPLLNNDQINKFGSNEPVQQQKQQFTSKEDLKQQQIQKQVFITNLMKKANVNVNTLEVNKKNILKLKFNKMLQVLMLCFRVNI